MMLIVAHQLVKRKSFLHQQNQKNLNEVVQATELVKNLEHMKSVVLLPCSATGMCKILEYFFLNQDNTEQNRNLFENLMRV